MKRSFGSLPAREALHVAIYIEERNADLYHRMGEVFAEFRDQASLEIAHVFWEMASEEREHENILRRRYRNRYGTRACQTTEEHIQELIEVPRLRNAKLLGETRRTNRSALRREALKIAEAAEMQAHRFYANLAAVTRQPGMRSLYREFEEFEGEHCDWIRKKLRQAEAAARTRSTKN